MSVRGGAREGSPYRGAVFVVCVRVVSFGII